MKASTASLLLTIGLTLTGAAVAQTPIVIKFSHVASRDTPKGQAADRFKQLVEERTQGGVKVEVYSNSTLYKDKEELEALQLGAVQMLAPVTSKFGPIGVKEFEALDLPYMFPSIEALRRVTSGPIGQGLMKKLEARNMVGLAFWDTGFRVMSANRPLHTPDAMKGLKMRINSSKVNEAMMRSVGAIPQTMALSEVYQALQSGVVDGTDGPIANLYTQKHYEVQKYISLTEHTYSGSAVVVNKKFWESLTPELRATLEAALKEATAYNNAVADKDAAAAIAAIKDSGKSEFYIPTPTEKAAWVKAMQPVQDEMAPRVGRETIAAIRKEVGGLAAK